MAGEIIFFLVVIYFIPTMVATSRHINVGPVIVINLFFGWTLIGWVFALALASTSDSF